MIKILVGCATAVMVAGLLAVGGCAKTDRYLRVFPPVVELAAGVQSVTVSVEASAAWYPYTAEEWLQVAPDDADPTLLHIVIPAGAENNARSATVTIITGDAQTADIEVRQEADSDE